MNTPANAVPEAFSEARAVAPAAASPTHPMYWSIRRELGENRSIYIAPLAVAVLVLLGFLVATIGRALATHDLTQRQAVLEEHYTFATGLLMITAMLVGIFYCLDALHGERQDRSILFWKSLPVSDVTTVLSKASIPFALLPVITIAVIFATETIMLLLSSLVLLGSGLSLVPLWTHVPLFLLMLLYHLVTVHVLWHAPIYGWLLMVSAWAKRAALLWAVLPVLAICIVEKIAFNTAYFAGLLRYRMTGPEAFDFPHSYPMESTMHMHPGRFLSAPGLWIGLILTAGFLLAAVRLRRYRGPL